MFVIEYSELIGLSIALPLIGSVTLFGLWIWSGSLMRIVRICRCGRDDPNCEHCWREIGGERCET